MATRQVMGEERALEHRRHLMHVEGCIYCERRMRGDTGDEPTKVADFCLVHAEENCTEPDCYACGNHEIDEAGRCMDPRCGSLNTPEIVALLADFGGAPIELKRYMVGKYLEGVLVGVSKA